mmetsp:Transcript_23877/g.23555  ORF Transcript_23877/g.23555 Transcript_23877/m.23555 type:complete len:298 (+) Transcript_23877:737-1630(+)
MILGTFDVIIRILADKFRVFCQWRCVFPLLQRPPFLLLLLEGSLLKLDLSFDYSLVEIIFSFLDERSHLVFRVEVTLLPATGPPLLPLVFLLQAHRGVPPLFEELVPLLVLLCDALLGGEPSILGSLVVLIDAFLDLPHPYQELIVSRQISALLERTQLSPQMLPNVRGILVVQRRVALRLHDHVALPLVHLVDPEALLSPLVGVPSSRTLLPSQGRLPHRLILSLRHHFLCRLFYFVFIGVLPFLRAQRTQALRTLPAFLPTLQDAHVLVLSGVQVVFACPSVVIIMGLVQNCVVF